ncbi:uncharacterized protein LOC131226115 isoform X2 [Magnolia sinica]|uniref:uncharacterized protein LOC131226115 isoform X2 n=1 Tax=Magnolia sinica TaxID=86752 RepID=UPI00265892D3|nr:uncharacterized protein LOC131226115 isoform X2 [Magnolia sinica]
MGFNAVFRSLQEIFPQVDVRILKAVAIEHSKDVDAAVESVLLEVLPTICSPQEDLTHDYQQDKHPSVGGVQSEEQSLVPNRQEVAEEAHTGSCSQLKVFAREDFDGPDHQTDSLNVESTWLDDNCSVASVHPGSEHDQLSMDAETGAFFPTNHQNTNLVIELNQGSYAAPISRTHHDDADDGQSSNSLFAHIKDLHGKAAYDSVMAHEDCLDVNSSKDGTTIQHLNFQPLIIEDKHDSIDDASHVTAEEKDVNSFFIECFGSVPRGNHENGLDINSSKDGTMSHVTAEEKDVNSFFIECFGTVSRGNRENGLDTNSSKDGTAIQDFHFQPPIIEEKHDSMGHVTAEEKDANFFVSECIGTVARGSLESGAEQLVFDTEMADGESDLTTSAAQSSQIMSIDFLEEFITDAKSNKMCRDLQARLAAAEAERAAAEQEKREKEESAQKAFAEQELIMERVVQESKKLQQEAEENAKLREFLMDRGRVVDVLQGEIAVICEDVKELKERIDGRLPVSKSLSSSQASYILASSSTSQKSAVTEQDGSSESLKASQELLSSVQSDHAKSSREEREASGSLKTSQELSSSQQSDGAKSSREEKEARDGKKVPLDDEWYLCD